MALLLDSIPGASPSSRMDAGLILRMLKTHPARQSYRWWRAYENPAVPVQTKETPAEGKVTRIEQTFPVGQAWRGIFDVHRTSRTYRDAFGSLDESSTTLLYIPSETQLAVGDHILPWGMRGDGSDVAHKVSHQTIVRGGQRSPGAGRITITAGALTCTVPHLMQAGDIVYVLGVAHSVTVAPTATTATIYPTVATPITTAVTWELGRDWLGAIFPKRVESLLVPDGSGGYEERDCGVVVRSSLDDIGTSFVDPGTGEKRCWLDWSSEPRAIEAGEAYSVRVESLPLYRVSESGIQLPGWDYQSIYAQLASDVIKSPRSLPILAQLTLVVR